MSTKTDEAPAQHPLFLRYDIGVIARRLGYNEHYLLQLKYGDRPVTARFRRNAAREFRKPESELFLNED